MKKERNPLWEETNRKQARPTWIRMGVLMALLLAAGILLLRDVPAGEGAKPTPSASPPGAVQTATPAPKTGRSARELAYDKDVETLTLLIAQQKENEAVFEQASRQLAQMVQDHQTELGIEEALTQTGFAPCMALLQNNALTVTVGARELTETQSVTILSICMAHSDVAVENVRIMTGESAGLP